MVGSKVASEQTENTFYIAALKRKKMGVGAEREKKEEEEKKRKEERKGKERRDLFQELAHIITEAKKSQDPSSSS